MTIEELKEKGQVYLIDKPLTWTSFDVVNKMRYTLCRTYSTRKLKVGHAGTLDPLASGLLIVCAGRETKNIDSYQAREKEYTGSITLGACTPSYDAETEVTDKKRTAGIETFCHEIGVIIYRLGNFKHMAAHSIRNPDRAFFLRKDRTHHAFGHICPHSHIIDRCTLHQLITP